MNSRETEAASGRHTDSSSTPDVNTTSIQGDTTIIEGASDPAVRGPGSEYLRIAVGAQVYSSDGQLVAVVEITNADSIGIRAGSPGRSIVVPANGIARVSPEGQRVDLYASAETVRSLSADNEPGSKHLEAQQPETLARESLSRSADDQESPTTD